MKNLFAAQRDPNLTEGPVFRKIIIFSLPLMLTNLLQMLYSAADMIVAGLSGVDGAIGSIGTTGAFINLLLNIFMGFSVGTNVVVARAIGSGKEKKVQDTVHTSVIMGLGFGLLCGAVGYAFTRPVLKLLGDEGHVLELAVLYTHIYFAGAPFISLANFFISIFRAKGDTSTPLFVLTGTGLLNVGLNLMFVLVFHMSVDGVAYATVISNIVSVVILGFCLSRDTSACRFSLKKLTVSMSAFHEIVREGIPAAVQGVVFSLSNMLIQSSILRLNNSLCPGGSDIIDGNAAAGNLEGFLYVLTNSVYQASITFTSQYYGARKYKGIGTVMRACYLFTFIVATVSSGLAILFRYSLLGLYVHTQAAVEAALTRVYIMFIPYSTLAFMEVGSGIVRGLGRSSVSALNSLLGCCVFRVLWILIVFEARPTLAVIYLSYPLSWAITAAVQLLFALRTRKKLMKTAADAV